VQGVQKNSHFKSHVNKHFFYQTVTQMKKSGIAKRGENSVQTFSFESPNKTMEPNDMKNAST